MTFPSTRPVDDPPLITAVFDAPVEGPGAWKSSDFAGPEDYAVQITPAMLADIDAALASARASATTLENVVPRQFSLPSLRPLFEEIIHEITDGRGFVLVRGLPAGRYTKDEIRMLFWVIGTHFGIALPQNKMGDRLGDVRDLSGEAKQLRGYRTKEELSFHTDIAEIVGLLCLSAAKSGGASQIASALTLHNLMREERPDLLDRLYRGYFYDRAGEAETGGSSITGHRLPAFINVEGNVSARLFRPLAEAGMAAVGQPFDQLDREAFDFLEAAARRPDVMLEFILRPGEFYFINNYTILHARTAFEDFEEPARKRHLCRLWLDRPGMRPIHPNIHFVKPAPGQSQRI